MASPHTPWGARVTEVLSDGEWHHIEDVTVIAAPLVPPGVAYRFQERGRLKSRNGAAGPERRQLGDSRSVVDVGKRAVVRKVLFDRVARGSAERSGSHIRSAR